MSVSPGSGNRGGLVGWLEERINVTEIFSFLTHFGFVYTPIDTTRPLGEVTAKIGEHRVPAFAAWPRVLGLLAAILIASQVVTGLLLAFYYRPTPDAAFESVRTIVRDVPMGWFIHQMHTWGAKLLIVVVVLRVLRLFWDALYRAPREVLWWCAIGLGWLVLQSEFTGRLLAWDAHGYWTTVRGMEVVFSLPIVGPMLAFLLGGRIVNEEVLIRFYVLHIMVLPLAIAVLIYLTFATLRRVGLSPEDDVGPGPTTTFRDHLFTMIIMSVLLFGVLVTLASLLPFRFETVADPYATPVGVQPPWYMLPAYAIQQWGPGPMWLKGGLLLIVSFGVFFLPLWAPAVNTPRERLRSRMLGGVGFLAWVALGIAGALLERS